MPGPAVHNIVSENLAAAFQNRQHTAAANAIKNNQTAVTFGSQGPDFLFFNLSDFPVVTENIVKIMVDVADAIAEFKQTIRDAFPIIDKVDKWADDAVESSHTLSDIKDMATMLSGTVKALTATVKGFIKTKLLDAIDVFSFYDSPVQNCLDNRSEWWWFDTLHYRQTGQFATELLKQGQNDDQVRAYALGYLSHFAADVVGHSYVNMIVRGPYRTHAQRHNVVEKFQDVWAHDHYHNEELVRSGAHNNQRFTKNGSPNLPDNIAGAFSSAAGNVYGQEYGPLSTHEVDSSYRLWYRYYRKSTEASALDVEIPRYDPPSTPTKDAWENFKDQVSDLFDGSGGGGGGGLGNVLNGLGNFLKELAEAILSGLALALSAIDWVISRITTLAKKALYFLLSKIYNALYDAWERFQYLTALLGFGFPLRKHLDRKQVRHMTDPTKPDARGKTLSTSWPWPIQALGETGKAKLQHESDIDGLQTVAHLFYPPASPEQETTTVAPDSYHTQGVDHYINGPINQSSGAVVNLSSVSDVDTHMQRMTNDVLGNAVQLTVQLYENYVDEGVPIPDLNLSGDRGMAHPTYEAVQGCAGQPPSLGGVVTPKLYPDN